MKTLAWAAVALAGFGLMLGSYLGLERIADPTPWTRAAMYLGSDEPDETDLAGLGAVHVRFHDLPLQAVPSLFVTSLRQADNPAADPMARGFAEKVILDPDLRRHITPDMLTSGRLPSPGADEVVGGCLTSLEEVRIQGRTLKVVGRLDRREAVFKRSYLMAAEAIDPSMPEVDDEQTGDAWIVPLSRDRDAMGRVDEAFPRERFIGLGYTVPVGPGAFALYMAGLATFLLGGSALFILLYGYLATRWQDTFVGETFALIHRWRWLNILVHGLTFGAALAAMVVAFLVPEVEFLMRQALAESARQPGSPLGYAVEVYSSGSIPLAAAVTFAVNMASGTLLGITLPSLVVPGAGLLINVGRLAALAPVLAPTSVDVAGQMVPHAVTMLLEVEAYIVASLLGLMVPIYLFRSAEGPSWPVRYGRAVLVNLKGLPVVFAILAIAAVYEAVEVILQFR